MPKDMRQIPISIGPLEEHGWLGGLALNEYVGRKASYSTGSDGGIDPFRKPGVLQAGYRASSVNAFVTTQINAMVAYLASGSTRLYGNSIIGRVYQIDTSNHANVSVIASLNSINQDYGFAVSRDYLFTAYNPNASVTYLTRIGPLSTGVAQNVSFNVSMISQVQGVQIRHVLMPWKSNLYCLHANNIDYLDGNGVTTGILTVGARLPSGMVIKTATPYGDRIAVGASDNLVSSSNRGTRAVVYVYDGVSTDWEKEIPFPENDILDLAFYRGNLFAWGVKWLYRLDSTQSGFEAIAQLDTTAPGLHKMHDVNDGQLFFPASNVMRAYGRPIDYLQDAFTSPITAVGTGGVCKWMTNGRLYVSNNAGNLLYASASAETSVRYKTRFIEAAGAKFRVAWVRVVTEALASGDSLQVEMNDVSGNNYVVGTMTFAGDGAILSKEFFSKDFTSEPPYLTEVQLALLFDGGNVKVRRVDMILETAQEY